MSRLLIRWLAIALTLGATAAVAACGSSDQSTSQSGIPPALLREARPIGRGPRFHPPARGPVLGPCVSPLGARTGVHVELFAENRVVLVAEGIGARPPLRYNGGRITGARCFGQLVTIDPTGLLLVRRGARLVVGDLFRCWGQPLSDRQLASFRAPPGTRVAAYVDGKPWIGSPENVPLSPHAEIVLEVGPHVPPHSSYTFPPGT